MKVCLRSLAGALPLLVLVCLITFPAAAAPIVFSATGASTVNIQTTVDTFRSALGPLNPNVSGSFLGGRREINWDGVPDAISAPFFFPTNFFNDATPGRARGVVFSTPSSIFQVSADSSNPTATPIQYGNINPTYPSLFEPFSAEKLFTAVGSNITDVTFFVPGSTTPATVSAFGAVFSDVDLAGITSIQYFDQGGASLGSFSVGAEPGNVNQTFSFLGVLFDSGERVSRVRLTSGNMALSTGANESYPVLDLVVMDDFIYAEPLAAPLPGTFLLMGTGLAGFWLRRCLMLK